MLRPRPCNSLEIIFSVTLLLYNRYEPLYSKEITFAERTCLLQPFASGTTLHRVVSNETSGYPSPPVLLQRHYQL
jgi:hypothetical protein